MHTFPLTAPANPGERRAPRGRAPGSRSRSSSHSYRRRAMAVPMEDLSTEARLLRFWNEHAVKTGMIVFYAWFVAANWSKLGGVASSAWQALTQ